MKKTALQSLIAGLGTGMLAACGWASQDSTTACYAAWNSATAYNSGAQISYSSVNYTAAFWTQNQNPSTNNGSSGSGQPWISSGACGAMPTPAPAPAPAPTPTPTPTPAPAPAPTGSCTQYVSGHTYNTGDKVTNSGNYYQCTVGGWCSQGGAYDPGTGWAWQSAWNQITAGQCGGTAPTPAPTPTPTPTPAPPPTPTPTTKITWPAGQLLPSFPAPAATQDLIILNAAPTVWAATSSAASHATGHNDGDGWLCQTGIDAPNLYMVYGPYDTNTPSGPNTAHFSIKIDNNTADNNPQVEIDVRDATTGASLASQTITRQQFTAASSYVDFPLAFTMPADGHQLELRVYWMGGAYIKVASVSIDRNKGQDDMTMFASLKALVNATQPRIFSYEGDQFAEGQYTWLQSLGLGYNSVSNNWSLITKYRSEISGLIVYDDTLRDTINLAGTLAVGRKALVVSPSEATTLTAAPYSLPILMDLRGKYANKLAVYQDLYNVYWPSLTHKVLFGLSPTGVLASSREYAGAIGAAMVWLDPRVPAESTLLNSFLSSMGAGTVYMGWWPEEGSGVTAASQYGIATVASDYATNLTLHSGMPRTVTPKAIPPTPALQNKIYVAFILSDGDNLQYVEHLARKLWNDPGRGQVPMGWTMSPAMLDAMPGALNYYWSTATSNDELLSGPSGYGYTYPNNWPSETQLDQFVAKTDDYLKRAGFRVITVWNTIIGGINANVGQSYATNAPSLLGLTSQNTGGGLTIFGGKLPSEALTCNYCATEDYIKSFIASGASGWNRTSPLFLVIQAQPWQGVTPSSFLDVKNSLSSDYVVVRPDHLFQLVRQANGLPAN
ncbi:GxGYxYP domain-containing protein [Andreprevotia chitinilytica]|uniref:GxGYxYP domain-containing protein n=1 Tax=Andreprevotia chitinilytica TaxID=396808 RepID=UPI000AF96EE9|nr:GxGYxYP domain-containing protein [Andreprevotia chitinilytica]